MSRTDKDRPYRIKIQDETLARRERHDHRPRVVACITDEEKVTERRRHWLHRDIETTRTYTKRTYYNGSIPVECDIDVPDDYSRRRWGVNRCGYELSGEPKYWHTTAPREFRNSLTRTNRRKVKHAAHEAARDYNENGDTDIEPLDKYAPRSAAWLYW